MEGAAHIFERYARRPHTIARLRGSEFATDLEALVLRLEKRGHRPAAIRGYLWGAAHLAACIEKGLVCLNGLTADGLQDFARRHARSRRCGCSRIPTKNFVSVARHFFEVMRHRGRCSAPCKVPRSPAPFDRLLDKFDQHLRDVRGLAPATRERLRRDLRPLLESKYGAGAVDVSAITVPDVRHWVRARAATTSPRTAKATATAIRSLLRFCAFRGWSAAHLAAAVPALPASRMSGPPRSLSDQQLAQLMRSIDVSKPIGLRTRAIIECAVSLGLRAGEIAALRIRDVDWREGAIRMPKTKSRRMQVMPLPRAVGQAMASYLKRGRPKSRTDLIFVRHYFPIGGPLQSKDISATVRRGMVRAGLQLPSMGAHSLRHTVASRLVRAGVGIKDIADVMRHRELDTTRIYAGVDWPRLNEVALPWPTATAP